MKDHVPFPPIEIFEVLTSTLDSIHQAAAAGAPQWTTHIALEQTKGRGQKNRSWWSPPGAGLWMSTLLRPECDRKTWGGIALIAGAAAKNALAELGVEAVELRWPNDLYAQSRKLGGILAESKDPAAGSWVSLGIGLNIDLQGADLDSRIPMELREQIICLSEAGPVEEKEPEKIAMAILHELRPLYERLQQEEPIREIVGDNPAAAGRKVRIEQPGRPLLQGTTRGLGKHGELVVEDAGGTIHEIVAGDVSWDT
ncbi:MAG: biotin--[acetyl-CoA-carboxylase] ligase [Planctomycetota bacterium]